MRHLPRAPRKVDTATLVDRLAEHGMEVTQRTVQRDLNLLAEVFPLEQDDRSKPFGWSWSREAAPLEVPALDPRAAVTYRLIGQWLGHLLPRTAYREIQPRIDRAQEVLDHLDDNPLARWPDKVRVVPQGLEERPPQVEEAVLDGVYEALLRDRLLEVTYCSRRQPEPRTRRVHPLGLVASSPLMYLVCVMDGYDNVILMALHRMMAATVLEEPRRAPLGFSLDRFLAEGGVQMTYRPDPVRLVALLEAGVTRRLEEAPLGDDQVLTPEPDGRVRLEVTQPDSFVLRRWLLALGRHLEVLEPPELRAEMAEELLAAAARYAGPAPEV